MAINHRMVNDLKFRLVHLLLWFELQNRHDTWWEQTKSSLPLINTLNHSFVFHYASERKNTVYVNFFSPNSFSATSSSPHRIFLRFNIHFYLINNLLLYISKTDIYVHTSFISMGMKEFYDSRKKVALKTHFYIRLISLLLFSEWLIFWNLQIKNRTFLCHFSASIHSWSSLFIIYIYILILIRLDFMVKASRKTGWFSWIFLLKS